LALSEMKDRKILIPIAKPMIIKGVTDESSG
jgi:hypothetical protein